MKKGFAFFAFLSMSVMCLIWGGVLTSCKHSSSGGGANEPDVAEPDVAELDLTMYKLSTNKEPINTFTYVIGDENQEDIKFYVQSLNYPDKNQIELESAVYKLGEGGDDKDLDTDEDIAVAYKKANKNYKITLRNNMPQQPGSYIFTLSFSADNEQEGELEFTVEVSKKVGDTVITKPGPKITEDVKSGSGESSVTLKVVASVADGTEPAYQWYQDNKSIPNATESSYTATETGAYYVKVSANDQTVVSNTANVVIGSSDVTIPTITISAVEPYKIEGGTLKVPKSSDGVLSVSVDVEGDVKYQWYKSEETSGSDKPLEGETNYTYIPDDFAIYYCKVSVNGHPYDSSNVKVIEKDIKLTYTTTYSGEAYIGDTLEVMPDTDVPCSFAFQWYRVPGETSEDEVEVSGETNAIFKPEKEGWYFCKITPTSIAMGTKGSKTDTPKVHVREKTANDPDTPTVTITGNTSLKEGDKLSLSVTATASNGELSYQWMKGNNDIANATNSTYEISKVTTSDAGTYKCRVTNTFNNKTMPADSDTVTVTVTKAGVTSGNANGSFDFKQ